MDIICGERGSGRTHRCFEYARKHQAIIVSDYAERLKVKAKALHFDDLEIIRPSEIYNCNGRNVVFYKGDEEIKNYFKAEMGANLIAISFADANIKGGGE